MITCSAVRPLGEAHRPPPDTQGGGLMPRETVAVGKLVPTDHGRVRRIDLIEPEARVVRPRGDDGVERGIGEPGQHASVPRALAFQLRFLLLERQLLNNDRFRSAARVGDHLRHGVADHGECLMRGRAACRTGHAK